MEENAILQGEKAAGNVLLHSTRSASSFGAKDEPIGKDSVEGGAVAGSRSESESTDRLSLIERTW